MRGSLFAFRDSSWLRWGEHVSKLRFILRPAWKRGLAAPRQIAGETQKQQPLRSWGRLRSFFPLFTAPLGRAPQALRFRNMLSFVAEAILKDKKIERIS